MLNSAFFKHSKPTKLLFEKFNLKQKSIYNKLLFKSFLVLLLELFGLGIMYLTALIILDADFINQYGLVEKWYTNMGISFVDFKICLLGVLALIFVIKNIVYFYFQKSIVDGAFAISSDFSDRIVHALLDSKTTRDDDSAKALAEITSTTNQVAGSLILPSLLAIAEIVFLVCSLVLVTIYKPRLSGFLILTLLPPALFVLVYYQRVLKKKGQEVLEELPHFYSTLHHLIYGKKEVNLYQRKKFFLGLFSSSRENMYQKKSSIFLLTSSIPHKVLETAAVLSIFALALYAYISNDFNSLAFMMALFGSVAFRLLPSINRIVTSLNTMNTQVHLLDFIPSEVQNPTDYKRKGFQKSIVLNGVNFYYQEKNPVLDGLTWTLKKGDYIGIMGGSGSGKSTLLKLISGSLKPVSGEILWDGLKENHTSFKISMVSQEPYLLSDSVANNIYFGHENKDAEKIMSLLDRLLLTPWLNSLPDGINTQLGERGSSVSGGQAQRIALARALYQDPEILILDESLNALDSQSQELVLTYLNDLVNRGLTIIQVAHHKQELKNAHKIYTIEKGKITH